MVYNRQQLARLETELAKTDYSGMTSAEVLDDIQIDRNERQRTALR